MLYRIKNRINRYLKGIRHDLKTKKSKILHISIGENCLTDNILMRHGLKSFSTPYSHGRSNIDYALELEETNYIDFLNPSNLEYQKFQNETVVRSTKIIKSDNIFNEGHRNGFEFTHHDVITNYKARKSLERKINRLIKYRQCKPFVLYYHHRVTSSSNYNLLVKKLKKFVSYYSTDNVKSYIVLFTQEVNDDKRELEIEKYSEYFIHYRFYTKDYWAGEDELFWAINDDDLIMEMIEDIKVQIN